MRPDDAKTLVAVSVPVRDYVAVFSAAGSIKALAKKGETIQEHFNKLCELPSGTSLIYIAKSKGKMVKKTGIFLEKKMHPYLQKPAILIQLEKIQSNGSGGLSKYFLPEECTGVSVAEGQASAKLPKKQIGRTIDINTPFISCFWDLNNVESVLASNKEKCRLIGIRNQFAEELQTTKLRFRLDDGTYSGTLQDIVRVRGLSCGCGYQSDIIPSSCIQEELENDKMARISIFDGAKAYLRLFPAASSPVNIVILDRSDRSYGEAVEQINSLAISEANYRYLSEVPFSVPQAVSLMIMERGGSDE